MPNRIAGTAAIALLLLLGACSSADPEPPQVASLATPEAKASPSSPSADQRPVIPIDATEADIAAFVRPWEKCLVQKGGAKYKGQGQAMLVKGVEDMAKDDPAIAACSAKQPEAFDEHMERTNPTEFKDNQREWYQCAKRQGYKLSAPDPENGEFGLTEIGPNGDFGSAKMQECRREAFAS